MWNTSGLLILGYSFFFLPVGKTLGNTQTKNLLEKPGPKSQKPQSNRRYQIFTPSLPNHSYWSNIWQDLHIVSCFNTSSFPSSPSGEKAFPPISGRKIHLRLKFIWRGGRYFSTQLFHLLDFPLLRLVSLIYHMLTLSNHTWSSLCLLHFPGEPR